MKIVYAVEEDSCAKSLLKGHGASSEIAPHAHAHEWRILAVYIRPGQSIIHGGRDDRLPVITKGKVLFADRCSLSKGIEDQAVVAAAPPQPHRKSKAPQG